MTQTKQKLDDLKTTPDCCNGWTTIKYGLDWYYLADNPDLAVMPCINGLRVNHCPCCGAERRMTIWDRTKA